MTSMLTAVVASMAMVIDKCGGDDVDVYCGGGSGDEHGAGDI